MNVVQCLSHSIEEYDMLKLYARLGINAFSVGGYIDPAHPHDDKRPGVPEMPCFPELKAAVDGIGADDNLGAAQARLPDALLDWADVIVYHHYLDRLYDQWDRIEKWRAGGSHRRVIWRTVGQSVDGNEEDARRFVNRGLEIVRYSPKEVNIPGYAGSNALIRFVKDPDDWYGWTGKDAVVGNVTQGLFQRDPWTNYGFWKAATEGLPTRPAGPGSEVIGGLGALSYDEMRQYLRDIRCMVYTGTQPASYTLGLIEAMMTGVPIAAMGPKHFGIFEPGPLMYEAHQMVLQSSNDPDEVQGTLKLWLASESDAAYYSEVNRANAIHAFGKDTVDPQWRAYLGA